MGCNKELRQQQKCMMECGSCQEIGEGKGRCAGLSNDVRQCDFPAEEPPPTPPPPPAHQPKRPLLSSSFVCGWRATALHFTRPSDVRRREPRAKDIVAIANQPHALTSANGWKVHHLTAQMDDLVSLESDVGSQLSNVLRALESTHNKAQAALAPHSHALLELIKILVGSVDVGVPFLLEAYNEAALSERTYREWFEKFKNGDFDVEDKDERPKIYEDAELEELLEEDSSQTQNELAL
ncbi:Mariner Mos1 transposase [Eumeta japonica]|uniref:Mariner Mos1 transposase n=1 Tax=Eumeta variegata TaxID=151549 RepID=A0A4C1ZCW3_EUMVA|nr:Mariner Mos1 transposase [Eumeta japonica]